MSEGFAKKKNIYLEGMITTLILFFGPLLMKYIFSYAYKLFDVRGKELEIKFFAYIICVLFDLSFILSGGLKEPFEIVKNRLEDLFDVLFISYLKDTLKCWFNDFIEKGFFFWIYLGIIISHIYILVDCLMIYFK